MFNIISKSKCDFSPSNVVFNLFRLLRRSWDNVDSGYSLFSLWIFISMSLRYVLVFWSFMKDWHCSIRWLWDRERVFQNNVQIFSHSLCVICMASWLFNCEIEAVYECFGWSLCRHLIWRAYQKGQISIFVIVSLLFINKNCNIQINLY